MHSLNDLTVNWDKWIAKYIQMLQMTNQSNQWRERKKKRNDKSIQTFWSIKHSPWFIEWKSIHRFIQHICACQFVNNVLLLKTVAHFSCSYASFGIFLTNHHQLRTLVDHSIAQNCGFNWTSVRRFHMDNIAEESCSTTESVHTF